MDALIEQLCCVCRRMSLLAFAITTWASVPLTVAESVTTSPISVIELADPDADASNPQRRSAVVTALALSPGGEQLAAGGDDHVVRLFDVSTGKLTQRFAGHRDWIHGLSLASDGTTLASVGSDHTCRLWEISTGEPIDIALRPADSALRGVAFHPNGLQIATVGFGCPACVFNLSGGEVSAKIPCPCRDTQAVTFSPDGSQLAAVGSSGHLRVWDAASNEILLDIQADQRRIRDVAYSPDNRMIATGGDGDYVRLWNATTGEPLGKLPVRPAKAFCLKFIDNNRLAVGGSDNAICIWDVARKTELQTLRGHTGSITSLAIDANGQTLASGSYDTTIRVWRLNDPNEPKTARHPVSPAR